MPLIAVTTLKNIWCLSILLSNGRVFVKWNFNKLYRALNARKLGKKRVQNSFYRMRSIDVRNNDKYIRYCKTSFLTSPT